ncbi:hypothetical protein [Thioalkalivibrio thiocyanodenitrificans]|uniref:hypothetical protein n=1 Tax=Thioalkalivibrio thiocyanodenitrificans TaxID=243063 RepID=UPI00036BFB48|nr:hypothetical protein [Thioalkalivibrio thiocyanodenitrificans]
MYVLGAVECIDIAENSFGESYLTIDGVQYVSFFNPDTSVGVLDEEAQVVFKAMPGPTYLNRDPDIWVDLPKAEIIEVITGNPYHF